MSDVLRPNAAFQNIAEALRGEFPSLQRVAPLTGQPVVYLDGPAGSQVPQAVIDAISDYYVHHNANSGGKFATSVETSEMMAAAHQAAAEWFGARDASECIFGANMTTMTFAMSRALSRTWNAGDRVVVTELDHDGNVTPWKLAARDAGVNVETVRVQRHDATLDIDDFRRAVVPGTRLVAVTCASNSVGSRTPIREMVDIAHSVGAEVYLDAVHYAPHDLIDVEAWEADYCVCSAYKFFGPHVGMLWARRQRLEELVPYKLRPSPSVSPGKWMTGTQNFAAISGAVAAIDYLARIGQQLSSLAETSPCVRTRRENLKTAFESLKHYEMELAAQLLEGLKQINGVTVFGISDEARFADRVPTFAINIAGLKSQEVASRLAEQGIFCWGGDYYAVDVCAALGQQPDGMVRLGILHTNTPQDIVRTLEAIAMLAFRT
jgi:cysteine desulfurase family protein (TIGR01976 family)